MTASGLVGTKLGDRLQIGALLGNGGMGAVYRARHVPLEREVAVKVIAGQIVPDPQLVKRFEREARAMSLVDHPNVVRVLDFGHDGARLFLVMEYVAGESLHSFLTHHAPLDAKLISDIGAQILDGLAAVHRAGLVHRDVKPGNVMLVARDGYLTAKVCDFGLATLTGDPSTRLTKTGAVVGTPSYMAPEQVLGTAIHPATDIYAAGAMLFEMATGRAPFSASTPVAVLMKHVQEDPPSPREYRPELPPTMEEIILRALSKIPEVRPSAEQLALELRDPQSIVRGSQDLPRRRVRDRFTIGAGLLFAAALCIFAFVLFGRG